MQNNLNAQLGDELQDDGDGQIIFVVLVGQLGKNLDESHKSRGGSKLGRKPNLERGRVVSHIRIFHSYFAMWPIYNDKFFRCRFRMRRKLFLKIMEVIIVHDSYFLQKKDATKLLDLSSIQKCTSTIRMLAYSVETYYTNEYFRSSESSALEHLKRFVKVIQTCLEANYLKQLTLANVKKQMKINKERGFPSMFASIDCMHWSWKYCPMAWQGQYKDKERMRSIIHETIIDQSLWIWHTFFGLPGGNNDVNVLDKSPFVAKLLRGEKVAFMVDGTFYACYYLLTN